MGTQYKAYKKCKIFGPFNEYHKMYHKFCFFLKLFAKRNIKFCKIFGKNTISVLKYTFLPLLEDLYEIEYNLLENIHFFHYRKTCMKSSIISWIDITYPEATQVHIGWMECRLMFTPPQKKHKSTFHPT